MKVRLVIPVVLFLLIPVVAVSARSGKKTMKTIREVTAVQVDAPEGTAPRLPYLVWVTYADGTGAWRQVKWTNSLRETEEEEASLPSGSAYTVRGYILGDNTTDNGYPLDAQVTVVAAAAAVPAPTPVARPLPLGSVRLIGENRLTSNRDLDVRNLLSLDITQQLYNYRDTYGLPTEGYTRSDGWDSPTTKLKGHGSGHYMSALAFAFAGTDDPALKDALRKNIRRMVDELRTCQEMTFVWDDALGRYREARDLVPEEEFAALEGTWSAFNEYKKDCRSYGYGYINAIPAQHPVLIEKYAPYNNEKGVWAPYYSIHKQLAGLIDIAVNVDDPELAAKALLIAKDMGLWVWNRLHYRTYVKMDGDKAERQARPGNRYEMWNMYIAGEVGGMQESLSRLSAMVSDPTEKAHLLEAAECFVSPAFFDPLSKNIDDIRTRHANQHIPMIVGSINTYRVDGDPYYYRIASNFWEMVQGRYAYAMGGVGNGEMFRQPYSQMMSMNTSVQSDRNRNLFPNPDINETCCAYNLAKLTKDLNGYNPDDARYMDYYERVLYNQLVGSVNPDHYQVVYQYPVGLDAPKEWGSETPQSTCCGGTGAENHVKYQEAAYFVSSPSAAQATLWVCLYMPTTATWDAQGVTLQQQCQWPAERSTIRIVKGSGRFAMKLRVPYWATEGFDVRLNGKSVANSYQPCSYIEIPQRKWSQRDVVEVVMPFTPHLDYGPDKVEIADATPASPLWLAAMMRGPLVMADTIARTWQDATISHRQLSNLSSQLSKLIPDYDTDEHATHYFRIDAPVAEPTVVDTLSLQLAMKMARSRIEAQQAWQKNYQLSTDNSQSAPPAPWAPHGFARLQNQYDEAIAKDSSLTPAEAEKLIATLNTTLNTMCPGNLAEPEDMTELLQLLEQARQQPPSRELRRAIGYAEMVRNYVISGSGTTDMIQRAVTGLAAVPSAK